MYRNWASDPEVTKYLTWQPHTSIDVTLQQIDSLISKYEEPQIDGCVSVQHYISHDDFLERFIAFVEMHGWYFGGGTEEVTDKED